MSAGGLRANVAAITATPITRLRVHPNSAWVEWIGRIRFLKDVDAATSNTLSIDDIAAAMIATVRKSAAQMGKVSGAFSKVGTIRSVSVTFSKSKWL